MPPTTEHQGFLGRSILSIRRNQVSSMESSQEQELQDLDLFQKRISDGFLQLSSTSPDLLSIDWLRKLLDVYLCCEAEFKAAILLRRDPSHITKPPLDRQIPDLVDRAVKSLDICNAVTNGVESVQHWRKLAEIAVVAMEQKPLGEGQVKRARKALSNLVAAMGNEEGIGGDSGHGGKPGDAARRRRRRRGVEWDGDDCLHHEYCNGVCDVGAGDGHSLPGQVRGGIAYSHSKAAALRRANDRIAGSDFGGVEEGEEGESRGLLEELQRLDKCSHGCIELMDSLVFPVEEDKAEEIRAKLGELGETCHKMEQGLDPFRRQLREVFHRMVRSRAEILLIFDTTAKSPSPIL
ncbi:hypothetical protein Sjap_020970 [Stephania japonica]|uniref:Uncharacterized protein n=1 Tax=Stephania japonica TaxID=461633 RepID=A0AAP0F1Q4_9MAGN